MPRPQRQSDGDYSPDDRPGSERLAWLEQTRAALDELVKGESPRLEASAEVAGRLLAWLECDREIACAYIGRDRRSLRLEWKNGDRRLVVVITAGRLDYAQPYRGSTAKRTVLLRKQPLDILRTLLMGLDDPCPTE